MCRQNVSMYLYSILLHQLLDRKIKSMAIILCLGQKNIILTSYNQFIF